jgi:hypothetical protein
LLTLGVGAAAAISGCGSRAEQTASFTTCGIPYTFSAAGHAVVQSGSCAGLILRTAPLLAVDAGQRFSVEISHEQSGRLDLPIPKPATEAIRILAISGATITYQAVSTGTVLLLSHHTQLCIAADPRFATCAALKVVVR